MAGPEASFGEGTSTDRGAEGAGRAEEYRAEARSRRAQTAQTAPRGLRKRMESRRQLDSASGAGIRPRIIFALVLLMLGCVSWSSAAEDSPQFDRIAAIRKSFDEKRWQQVVEQAQAMPSRGAEVEYYYGVALAQLGRWDGARTVLLRGRRLRPRDERFPIELGGVAFRQKRYAEAAGWLRRGMRLNPGDTNAADFLATINFLQW